MAEADPEVYQAIPSCPVCGGRVELVYDCPKAHVCVCVDCDSTMHVPAKAWRALGRGVSKGRRHPER